MDSNRSQPPKNLLRSTSNASAVAQKQQQHTAPSTTNTAAAADPTSIGSGRSLTVDSGGGGGGAQLRPQISSSSTIDPYSLNSNKPLPRFPSQPMASKTMDISSHSSSATSPSPSPSASQHHQTIARQQTSSSATATGNVGYHSLPMHGRSASPTIRGPAVATAQQHYPTQQRNNSYQKYASATPPAPEDYVPPPPPPLPLAGDDGGQSTWDTAAVPSVAVRMATIRANLANLFLTGGSNPNLNQPQPAMNVDDGAELKSSGSGSVPSGSTASYAGRVSTPNGSPNNQFQPSATNNRMPPPPLLPKGAKLDSVKTAAIPPFQSMTVATDGHAPGYRLNDVGYASSGNLNGTIIDSEAFIAVPSHESPRSLPAPRSPVSPQASSPVSPIEKQLMFNAKNQQSARSFTDGSQSRSYSEASPNSDNPIANKSATSQLKEKPSSTQKDKSSSASKSTAAKPHLFGVRVHLPRGLSTIILCDPSTSGEVLLQKALSKMKVELPYDVRSYSLVRPCSVSRLKSRPSFCKAPMKTKWIARTRSSASRTLLLASAVTNSPCFMSNTARNPPKRIMPPTRTRLKSGHYRGRLRCLCPRVV